MAAVQHIPVLASVVQRAAGHLAALSASRGGLRAVDATAGLGGHTRVLLDAGARVLGVDRDRQALARCAVRDHERLTLVHARFSELSRLDEAQPLLGETDMILADLGVSSMQLDLAERGFSFRDACDGIIDMRMDQSRGSDCPSAFEIVNHASEVLLEDIVHDLGEEPRSSARRVARAIVAARTEAPIERTAQLARIVANVVRAPRKLHPATKTFQALRMYANDELGELESLLSRQAPALLRPGGLLVVISYHSLEDRQVKRALNSSPDWQPAKAFGRRPIVPEATEVEQNPRSRSAKLRVLERTSQV